MHDLSKVSYWDLRERSSSQWVLGMYRCVWLRASAGAFPSSRGNDSATLSTAKEVVREAWQHAYAATARMILGGDGDVYAVRRDMCLEIRYGRRKPVTQFVTASQTALTPLSRHYRYQICVHCQAKSAIKASESWV